MFSLIFLMIAIPTGLKCYLIGVFICNPVVINVAEHFPHATVGHVDVFFGKFLFIYSPYFSIRFFSCDGGCYRLHEFFKNFEYLSLIWYTVYKHFLPLHRLLFCQFVDLSLLFPQPMSNLLANPMNPTSKIYFKSVHFFFSLCFQVTITWGWAIVIFSELICLLYSFSHIIHSQQGSCCCWGCC